MENLLDLPSCSLDDLEKKRFRRVRNRSFLRPVYRRFHSAYIKIEGDRLIVSDRFADYVQAPVRLKSNHWRQESLAGMVRELAGVDA
jgi:hypothetical protein